MIHSRLCVRRKSVYRIFPGTEAVPAQAWFYDMMPQLLCQLVAASIGTCCRSRFGTGGKNQAVGKEAPLRGGDFEPFISCFPVPDRINPALRYRTDPAVVKLRSQHIENRRSLPGVGYRYPFLSLRRFPNLQKESVSSTVKRLITSMGKSATRFGNRFLHKTIGRLHLPFPVDKIFFPTRSICSSRVTWAPCLAAKIVAVMPEAPAPMIVTCFS